MISQSIQSIFQFFGKKSNAGICKTTNYRPMHQQYIISESVYLWKLGKNTNVKLYSTCYLTIDYDNSEKQLQNKKNEDQA